jgi:hypothetical protein
VAINYSDINAIRYYNFTITLYFTSESALNLTLLAIRRSALLITLNGTVIFPADYYRSRAPVVAALQQSDSSGTPGTAIGAAVGAAGGLMVIILLIIVIVSRRRQANTGIYSLDNGDVAVLSSDEMEYVEDPVLRDGEGSDGAVLYRNALASFHDPDSSDALTVARVSASIDTDATADKTEPVLMFSPGRTNGQPAQNLDIGSPR